MSPIDLFLLQLQDIFRWGLLVALVMTTVNTSAVTGVLVPIVAGLAFVAVLIPMTMTPDLAPQTTQMLTGVVANLVILAVVLGVRAAYRRFRPR
jgi:hypothetical protein